MDSDQNVALQTLQMVMSTMFHGMWNAMTICIAANVFQIPNVILKTNAVPIL